VGNAQFLIINARARQTLAFREYERYS